MHIELTYECNLRCRHCYVDFDNKEKEKYLTKEEWLFVIDGMLSRGIAFFTLSGGDPLCNSLFLEIYEYLWDEGAKIEVFTNSLLLNYETISLFTRKRPYCVEISLYGSTPAIHDFITRSNGAYDKTINNIIILKNIGIKVNLKSPVMSCNIDDIPTLFKLSNETLGCNFRIDTFLAAIEQTKEQCIDNCKLYLCSAGKIGYACDPYENISACLSDKNKFSIFEFSIDEICDSLIPAVISSSIDSTHECFGCQLRTACDYCPACDDGIDLFRQCQLTHAKHKYFLNLINTKKD